MVIFIEWCCLWVWLLKLVIVVFFCIELVCAIVFVVSSSDLIRVVLFVLGWVLGCWCLFVYW